MNMEVHEMSAKKVSWEDSDFDEEKYYDGLSLRHNYASLVRIF